MSVPAGSLAAHGASITYADGSGRALLLHPGLAPQAGHRVLARPRVTGLAIASAPGADGIYTTGEAIAVEVAFSESVTLSGGEATLALEVGDAARTATAAAGASGERLAFSYTVTGDDRDADGPGVGAGEVGLAAGATLQGAQGRDAYRAHAGLGGQAGHAVDGVGGVEVAIAGEPENGTDYYPGETIEVTATFGRAVAVDATQGVPTIGLVVGDVEHTVAWEETAAPTATLVFPHVVQADDVDGDGVRVPAGSLSGGGAPIAYADGSGDAVLVHGAADGHPVKDRPWVAGVAIVSAPGADGLYTQGETVEVEVTFSEPVHSGDGIVWLALGVGEAVRREAAIAEDAAVLVFRFAVQAADRDADGVSVAANALTLEPGTVLRGAGARDAHLAHLALGARAFPGHPVDGHGGIELAIASVPANGADYLPGETIAVTARFGRQVEVTGLPSLGLEVGGIERRAVFDPDESTATLLTFAYAVVDEDVDTDGVRVPAGTIALDAGATIEYRGGDEDAALGHPGLATQAGHKVKDRLHVTGIAFVSDPGADGLYALDEPIAVELTFSEAVSASRTGSFVSVALGVGDAVRRARLDEPDPARPEVLRFSYRVAAEDRDGDGAALVADSLRAIAGATLQDANGRDAWLGHAAVADADGTPVDGLGAVAVAIASTPANGTDYLPGETIGVSATFGRAVAVSGTPTIVLEVGDVGHTLDRDETASSATELVFAYEVAADDVDADGVRVPADRLSAGTGSIEYAGEPGTAAHLGHEAIGGHRVQDRPRVIGIALSDPGADGVYTTGERIVVEVTFSEPVTLAPGNALAYLGIEVGGTPGEAVLEDGGGTATLAFAYEVGAQDLAGFGSSAAVAVPAGEVTFEQGATLQGRGRPARVVHPRFALAGLDVHGREVIGVGIGIESESGPADGVSYLAGEEIEAILTFPWPVAVDTTRGTPRLALEVGGQTRHAAWRDGGASERLVFVYEVVREDADADGVSVPADALDANRAAIAYTGLAASGPAFLLHPAVPVNSKHRVGAPYVVAIAIASDPGPGADGIYGDGEAIVLDVTFSEAVSLAGGGAHLALEAGEVEHACDAASGGGPAPETLRFTCAPIGAGNRALDGVRVRGDTLELGAGATLEGAGGRAARLAHGARSFPEVRVVGGGAVEVAIDGGPPNGHDYLPGETIRVTATFPEAVMVTGEPTIGLEVGGETRTVAYTQGSGTDTLFFVYTVGPDDVDTDGVGVAPGSLSAEGGSIVHAGDSAPAFLVNDGTGPLSAHKVKDRPYVLEMTARGLFEQAFNDVAVEVVFSERLTLSSGGAVTLALEVGDATKVDTSGLVSVGGVRNRLNFGFEFDADDFDPDGVSIRANSLSVESGTLRGAGGRDAYLAHGAHALPEVRAEGGGRVDVRIASAPANGTDYREGETITVEAEFPHKVVATGPATIDLEVGAATRTLVRNDDSNAVTTVLAFDYEVGAHDLDADGVRVPADRLSAGDGSIAYAELQWKGVAALLHHARVGPLAAHKVQVAAHVTGIDIVSDPGLDGVYTAHEQIVLRATWSEPVTVFEPFSVTLPIVLGDVRGGTGYTLLVDPAPFKSELIIVPVTAFDFRLDVDENTPAARGLRVGAQGLMLSGETGIIGASGADARLAVPDAVFAEVAVGSGGGLALAFDSTPENGTNYRVGEAIRIAATWADAVEATGKPGLALEVGGVLRRAAYLEGSGTETLVFAYEVVREDRDTDGVSVPVGAIDFATGDDVDWADGSGSAPRGHGVLHPEPGHKAGGPYVTGIEGYGFGGGVPRVFTGGSGLVFEVTFSEPVEAHGLDCDDLGSAINAVWFEFAIGERENARTQWSTACVLLSRHLFSYAVQADDLDADGIGVVADSLALGDGVSLRSADGSEAALAHGEHLFPGVRIAGPGTVEVAMLSAPADARIGYLAGETVRLVATFPEAVTVTGTPTLELEVGDVEHTLERDEAASSATELVFAYAVEAHERDADGVRVPADGLSAGGGSIAWAAGAGDAFLGHAALGPLAGHKVDDRPTVIGIELLSDPGADGAYTAGERIRAGVRFSEPVAADTAEVFLTLEVGDAGKAMRIETGSAMVRHTFAYEVETADRDEDGVRVRAGRLTVGEGGTLRGAGGRDVNPAHEAHAFEAVRVAGGGTKAELGFASSPPNRTDYLPGETIRVLATFPGAVEVTGTPTLGLEVGSRTRVFAFEPDPTATSTAMFVYTVGPDDADTDGVAVPANSLGPPGSIVYEEHGSGAPPLAHGGLGPDAGHKVKDRPYVVDIALDGDPGADGVYTEDEWVRVRVAFSGEVTADGDITLETDLGTFRAAGDGATTGTDVSFAREVLEGDRAPGFEVREDGLHFNPDVAVLEGANGRTAFLDHPPAEFPTTPIDGLGGIAIGIATTPALPAGYAPGETIKITATFGRAVTVEPTQDPPTIDLEVGGSVRTVAFDEVASSATTLVFSYPVRAGDADADGVSVPANALAGAIAFEDAMEPATTGAHAAAGPFDGHAVELRPHVTGIALAPQSRPGPDGIYTEGETVAIEVAFSEAVTVGGGGVATLQFFLGDADTDVGEAVAIRDAGTDTDRLVFAYVVQRRDRAFSLSVPKDSLEEQTIESLDGRAAWLVHDAAKLDESDGRALVIEGRGGIGIAVTSTPGNGIDYLPPDVIEVTATFGEAVTVTGTPSIKLEVGAGEARVVAWDETDSTPDDGTLVFGYEVGEDDVDDDGVRVPANSLSAGAGSIVYTGAMEGAILEHAVLGPLRDHRVKDRPYVTGIALSGQSDPGVDGIYGAGEAIRVEVTFSEAVTVAGGNAVVKLALDVGGETREAAIAPGERGGETLEFVYAVVEDDRDGDGVSVPADALWVGTGTTLRGADERDARLVHGAWSIPEGRVAGGSGRAVEIVSEPANGVNSLAGETIRVAVRFGEPVTVTGAASIELEVGDATRTADYAERSHDEQTLLFDYEVVREDDDADGVSVAAGAIALGPDASIEIGGVAVALPALLGHAALEAQAAHKVGGPYVTEIALTSDPGEDGIYTAGEPISASVTFSEPVTGSVLMGLLLQTDDVRLAVGIGENETLSWNHAESNGTATHRFWATVTAANFGGSSLSIPENGLTLNPALDRQVTLTGADGRHADPRHGAYLFGEAPLDGLGTLDVAITSAPKHATGYAPGETIEVTATFGREVAAVDTAQDPPPTIELEVGGVTHTLDGSASSATTFVFAYPVQADDVDADGVSVPENSLGPPGSIVYDDPPAPGALPRLAHRAIGPDAAHKVHDRPRVIGVAVVSEPGPDGIYTAGEKIVVRVALSEPVTVSEPHVASIDVVLPGTAGVTTQAGAYLDDNEAVLGSQATPLAALDFVVLVSSNFGVSDELTFAAPAQVTLGGATTIQGANARDAALGLPALPAATIAVDGGGGLEVAIGSMPGNGTDYFPGERIEVTATFGRAVTVTAQVTIDLEVGEATHTLGYDVSASTLDDGMLVFAYEVQADDADADGVRVPGDTLRGDVDYTGAGVGREPSLLHPALGPLAAHKVQDRPRVTGVEIVSAPDPYDYYVEGETIGVEVTFSEAVTVTGDGAVTLALDVGGKTREAATAPGEVGGETVQFVYPVDEDDRDGNGVRVPEGALTVGEGATLRGANGRDAFLGLGLDPDDGLVFPDHQVDGLGAFTIELGPPKAGRPDYLPGETVIVNLGFQRAVGRPARDDAVMDLDVGGELRRASGWAQFEDDKKTVGLTYTVRLDDIDTDGVTVPANTLRGTEIRWQGGGKPAPSRHHPAQASTYKVKDRPYITAIAFDDGYLPGPDGVYSAGEDIGVVVTFSEPVTTSSHDVYVPFTLGGEEREFALEESATGSDTLHFFYQVQGGDAGADAGVEIGRGELRLEAAVTVVDAADVDRAAFLGFAAPSFTTAPIVGGGGITVAIATDGAPANGFNYIAGETVAVTLSFPTAIEVTGAPSIVLDIGAMPQTAVCAKGAGARELTCSYVVTPEDVDADGLEVPAADVKLNGGSITFSGGPAYLGHPALAPSYAVGRPSVDAIAHVSSPGPLGIYAAPETIAFEVTFSEPVTTVSGTAPELVLDMGGAGRRAMHVPAPGAGHACSGDPDKLCFAYEVRAADLDGNGVGVAAGGLVLGQDSQLLGAGGRGADPTHGAFDFAAAPVYGAGGIALSMGSAPGRASGYAPGETIDVRAAFPGPVTVTGAPSIVLDVGGVAHTAAYAGGSGSAALAFTYDVAREDVDRDGLEVAPGAIALGEDGAIAFADGSGPAFVRHTGLGPEPGHKVNAVLTGVAITSHPAAGAAYRGGETIAVTVSFAVEVTVTGTPTIGLEVGDAVQRAAYDAAGSTETALRFAWTVTAADGDDEDGVRVLADSLGAGGGAIVGDTGAAVPLAHPGLGPLAAHGVRAGLGAVALASAPGDGAAWRAGEAIAVTVSFGGAVRVDSAGDAPTIGLEVGDAVQRAAYDAAGSTGTALRFAWTVRHADGVDEDGPRVVADSLKGAITDGARRLVALGHGEARFEDYPVRAGLRGLEADSAPANGTDYLPGETIAVAVRFGGPVVVTGPAPALSLEIGATTRTMEWDEAVSGGAVLRFVHEVTHADGVDADGVVVPAASLAGAIADTTGTAAPLAHAALGPLAGHKVKDRAYVTRIWLATNSASPGPDGIYTAGEKLRARVEFSEAVALFGSTGGAAPTLALDVGGVQRIAEYESGAGLSTWRFGYEVTAADRDANGVAIAPDSLATDPNGFRVQAGSVDAWLGHVAYAFPEHRVGAGAESWVALTSDPGPDALYVPGDAIEVTVQFAAPVTVPEQDRVPSIGLEVGGAARRALYTGGSGSTGLTFAYEVVTADRRDDDGVSVAADSINGYLLDADGGSVALENAALGPQAGHRVRTGPKVDSLAVISVPSMEHHRSGKIYGLREELRVTATFSEPVTVDTAGGTPTLALDIGGAAVAALYDPRLSDGAQAVFSHRVAAGDRDFDGFAVPAGAIDFAGGAIRAQAADALAADPAHRGLAADGAHRVGDLARITAIEVRDGACAALGAERTVGIGGAVCVAVAFSEAVDLVAGRTAPVVEVTVGDGAREALHASGLGTAQHRFTYEVVEGDVDTDGVHLEPDALLVPGAERRLADEQLETAGGARVFVEFPAVPVNPAHAVRVDGVRPGYLAGSATVNGAALTLGFDEPLDAGAPPPATAFAVTVTAQGGAAGEPSPPVGVAVLGAEVTLTLAVAAQAGEAVTVAYADPGPGDDAGAVQDLAGNAAAALFPGVAATNVTPEVVVVESVAIVSEPGPDGVYDIGDVIEAAVVFSHAVTVDTTNGAPTLALAIGDGAPRQAAYHGPAEDGRLAFRYRVVEGDDARDGLAVPADALSAGGAAIRFGLADAALALSAVAADAAHRVDGVRPTLTSAAATGVGAAIALTFDEPLAEAAPATEAFAVTVAGDGARAPAEPEVGGVAVRGAAVTLTLVSAALARDDTVTLDYTPPLGTALRDLAGNSVRALAGEAVATDAITSATTTVVWISGLGPVNEGRDARFTLTRTDADEALTVGVGVAQGEDDDFLAGAPPDAVEFAAGKATAELAVATLDDAVGEDDGAVVASIVRGEGYAIATDGGEARVAVRDTGDPRMRIGFAEPEHTVPETRGTAPVTVQARMEPGVSPFDVEVALGTRAGSAAHGEDYTHLAQTVRFAAGDFALEADARMVARIERAVAILDNRPGLHEGEETFEVLLERPAGLPASVRLDEPAAMTVRIADVDAVPAITSPSAFTVPHSVSSGPLPVATLTAADAVAEGREETLVWSITGGADREHFTLGGGRGARLRAGKARHRPRRRRRGFGLRGRGRGERRAPHGGRGAHGRRGR